MELPGLKMLPESFILGIGLSGGFYQTDSKRLVTLEQRLDSIASPSESEHDHPIH